MCTMRHDEIPLKDETVRLQKYLQRDAEQPENNVKRTRRRKKIIQNLSNSYASEDENAQHLMYWIMVFPFSRRWNWTCIERCVYCYFPDAIMILSGKFFALCCFLFHDVYAFHTSFGSFLLLFRRRKYIQILSIFFGSLNFFLYTFVCLSLAHMLFPFIEPSCC